MTDRRITDPEVRLLAGLATTLEPDYVQDTASWEGSPFKWIKTSLPSRTVGAVGEALVAGWSAAKGFDVTKTGELWKSKQTLATHAYIFNLNLYPIFAPKLSLPGAVVDVVYRNYQMSTDTFAYMMRPPLAWQRPDESDVQGGWKDYSDFIR